MKSAAIGFLAIVFLSLLAACALVMSKAVAQEEDESVVVAVTMKASRAKLCMEVGCKSMTLADMEMIYRRGVEAGRASVENFVTAACRKDLT